MMSTDNRVTVENLIKSINADEDCDDVIDRSVEQTAADLGELFKPDAHDRLFESERNGAALVEAVLEGGEATAEADPFAGRTEDVGAEETRRKAELFNWADGVLGLGQAELELALEAAVKRFG